MLTDLDLAPSYRSGRDAILDDFYVPCLQEAVTYDRAAGFFSSSLLHAVAIAYSDFASRSGHMRLICSPALSPEDFDAMKSAHDASQRAQESIRRQLQAMIVNPQQLPATRLLATLVAADVMEVRIAFSWNPPGIFHDKLGLFMDENGRRVTFVGSANETWAAWGLNHESFEVFCSWRGERELLRTRNHAEYFERLWEDRETALRVESLDSVTRTDLLKVAEDSLVAAIDKVRRGPTPGLRGLHALLPHQVAVLQSWEEAGNRGVVNFATGAGKTLTAIEALRRWTVTGRPGLVLVPGQDLHRQWITELGHQLPSARLLLAGAGERREDWHRLLPSFLSGTASPHRVVVATMQTFASDAFQQRMAADGSELLVVIDEMHRAGTERVLDALEARRFAATLGLSATYRRQWDVAGTERLLAVVGPVLEPVIGLAEAMSAGLLVPYDYRLHTLTLDEDELKQYQEITNRIGRALAADGTSAGMSDYVRSLCIARARILKQARQKALLAAQILSQEYSGQDRWLVYCDSQRQLQSVLALCTSMRLPALEYHSSMTGDRGAVLDSLGAYGGIVVAIRCLDEGIDVPVCDKALIVASSTVEREYIQRRGRVLRRAPDKMMAVVHDLLLIDEEGGALTRGEAVRALDFARLARNPGARAQIQLMLALSSDVAGLDFVELTDDSEEE